MAPPDGPWGTVNVIALDSAGNLAVGVSTSGYPWKYPGRVGDSALIGAGNYCDNSIGGAACTGRGELAIRGNTARSVLLGLAAGHDPAKACAEALAETLALPDEFRAPLAGALPDPRRPPRRGVHQGRGDLRRDDCQRSTTSASRREGKYEDLPFQRHGGHGRRRRLGAVRRRRSAGGCGPPPAAGRGQRRDRGRRGRRRHRDRGQRLALPDAQPAALGHRRRGLLHLRQPQAAVHDAGPRLDLRRRAVRLLSRLGRRPSRAVAYLQSRGRSPRPGSTAPSPGRRASMRWWPRTTGCRSCW